MAETEQTLEELAKEKLSMGFMVRREMKKLPDLLADDEDALNLARGEYDGKEGLIVVTDRRVMFVEQGMIRHNFEDFPYEKVSSVKTESGIRSGKITIYASGNKPSSKTSIRRRGSARSLTTSAHASRTVRPRKSP